RAHQARRSLAAVAQLCRRTSLDGRRTIMIETTPLDTPVGTMHVGVRDGRLCLLELSDEARFRQRLERASEANEPAHSPAARRVVDKLRRYFAGEMGALDDIEVDPLGGTDFQRRVWQA